MIENHLSSKEDVWLRVSFIKIYTCKRKLADTIRLFINILEYLYKCGEIKIKTYQEI